MLKSNIILRREWLSRVSQGYENQNKKKKVSLFLSILKPQLQTLRCEEFSTWSCLEDFCNVRQFLITFEAVWNVEISGRIQRKCFSWIKFEWIKGKQFERGMVWVFTIGSRSTEHKETFKMRAENYCRNAIFSWYLMTSKRKLVKVKPINMSQFCKLDGLCLLKCGCI